MWPSRSLACDGSSRHGQASPPFWLLAPLVAWFLCMSDAEQVRDNRLGAAQRQGQLLAESQRPDPRTSDFVTHLLLDAASSTPVEGDRETSHGLDLDSGQGYLNRELS
jgi:hypothetical protein